MEGDRIPNFQAFILKQILILRKPPYWGKKHLVKKPTEKNPGKVMEANDPIIHPIQETSTSTILPRKVIQLASRIWLVTACCKHP